MGRGEGGDAGRADAGRRVAERVRRLLLQPEGHEAAAGAAHPLRGSAADLAVSRSAARRDRVAGSSARAAGTAGCTTASTASISRSCTTSVRSGTSSSSSSASAASRSASRPHGPRGGAWSVVPRRLQWARSLHLTHPRGSRYRSHPRSELPPPHRATDCRPTPRTNEYVVSEGRVRRGPLRSAQVVSRTLITARAAELATRQTVLPTSSATSRAPRVSITTPTGRPIASPFSLTKPVNTSTDGPTACPP